MADIGGNPVWNPQGMCAFRYHSNVRQLCFTMPFHLGMPQQVQHTAYTWHSVQTLRVGLRLTFNSIALPYKRCPTG